MTRYEEIDNKAEPIPVSVTTEHGWRRNFSYLTGVIVSSAGSPPKGLVARSVPAQTYAVFTHSGHVSAIPKTYAAIWDQWFAKRQGRLRRTLPRKHLPTFNREPRPWRHRDMDTGDVERLADLCLNKKLIR